MNRLNRREMLACIDAIALEVASKIADYTRIQDDVERLRSQVLNREDVPRNIDTHELVSQRFGARRTA